MQGKRATSMVHNGKGKLWETYLKEQSEVEKDMEEG